MEEVKEKFDAQFQEFIKNKKKIFIVTAEKYSEMLKIIQGDKEKGQLATEKSATNRKSAIQENNLNRRYSIHVENSITSLFHNGESAKEKPQKVVKQEELFDLLKTTHQKLGHGGRDTMWNDLRPYYGISK